MFFGSNRNNQSGTCKVEQSKWNKQSGTSKVEQAKWNKQSEKKKCKSCFLTILEIYGVAARQSGENAIPGICTPGIFAVFGGVIG